MNQNHCKFYSFMRATRGNWRNTLYHMSASNSCPCGKNPPCDGFLMAAAADGSLIVMPVEIVRQFTGESIEPSECRGTLLRKTFEAVFSQYIEWHTLSDSGCPILQLYQDADR